MNRYLLDTNIITAILKGNDNVCEKYWTVVVDGADIYISAITYYEIKRGFLWVGAPAQLNKFEEFCEAINILYLGEKTIFDKASEFYARLKKSGKEHKADADIFIAASATIRKLTLVSDDGIFTDIGELALENWINR